MPSSEGSGSSAKEGGKKDRAALALPGEKGRGTTVPTTDAAGRSYRSWGSTRWQSAPVGSGGPHAESQSEQSEAAENTKLEEAPAPGQAHSTSTVLRYQTLASPALLTNERSQLGFRG